MQKNISFQKRRNYFEEGSAVKGIYFINKGKVKLHMKWENDKGLIVRFACDGDIRRHKGYGSELMYHVSATALKTSDICFIDNEFFFPLLRPTIIFFFRWQSSLAKN